MAVVRAALVLVGNRLGNSFRGVCYLIMVLKNHAASRVVQLIFQMVTQVLHLLFPTRSDAVVGVTDAVVFLFVGQFFRLVTLYRTYVVITTVFTSCKNSTTLILSSFPPQMEGWSCKTVDMGYATLSVLHR